MSTHRCRLGPQPSNLLSSRLLASPNEPKIVDFAVADVAALIPKTLQIELQDGELTGTFELG